MNIFNKNFLKAEVSKWLEEGIITRSFAQILEKRYGFNLNEESNNFILKIVGYLFIALSLIVLIGANWEEIPRHLRLFMLIALTFLAQVSGYVSYKNGDEKSAVGLFFLGNLIYGASIILIAQTYHLGEHMPDGVFWWAIGSLMFAAVMLNKFLMMQALILGIIWAGIEFFIFYHSAMFFVVFLIMAAIVLFKEYSGALLFLNIGGVYLFSLLLYFMDYKATANTMYYSYNGVSEMEFYFFNVFLFVTIGIYGFFANFKTRYSDLGKRIAAIVAVIFLLCFSIHTTYDEIPILQGASRYIFIFIVAAFGLFALHKRHFGFGALCMLYILMPYIFIYQISTLTVSVTVFLMGVGFIKQSTKTDSKLQLYGGMSTIFLIAIIRYFSLLGDYIGASMLFLVFAVVMLAVSSHKKGAKNEK